MNQLQMIKFELTLINQKIIKTKKDKELVNFSIFELIISFILRLL